MDFDFRFRVTCFWSEKLGYFFDELDGFFANFRHCKWGVFTRRFSFQKIGLKDVVLFSLRPNYVSKVV
jgi:hypothetical protein